MEHPYRNNQKSIEIFKQNKKCLLRCSIYELAWVDYPEIDKTYNKNIDVGSIPAYCANHYHWQCKSCGHIKQLSVSELQHSAATRSKISHDFYWRFECNGKLWPLF